MLMLLQESVLVLLIVVLTGVRYETVQNVPPRFEKVVHEDCIAYPQAQSDDGPDAGRHSALTSGCIRAPGGSRSLDIR